MHNSLLITAIITISALVSTCICQGDSRFLFIGFNENTNTIDTEIFSTDSEFNGECVRDLLLFVHVILGLTSTGVTAQFFFVPNAVGVISVIPSLDGQFIAIVYKLRGFSTQISVRRLDNTEICFDTAPEEIDFGQFIDETNFWAGAIGPLVVSRYSLDITNPNDCISGPLSTCALTESIMGMRIEGDTTYFARFTSSSFSTTILELETSTLTDRCVIDLSLLPQLGNAIRGVHLLNRLDDSNLLLSQNDGGMLIARALNRATGRSQISTPIFPIPVIPTPFFYVGFPMQCANAITPEANAARIQLLSQ